MNVGLYRWKPSRGAKLVFGVETLDPSMLGVLGTSAQRNLQEFHDEFGLVAKPYKRVSIPLADRRVPHILDRIADLKGRHVLRLSACWVEEPEPRASKAEWFTLGSAPGEFRGPGRGPPHEHLMWNDHGTFASAAFVTFARSEGLSGLGVLPLAEPPPAGVSPWFEVYAERPLGRGVDHPLLDYSKWASAVKHPRDPDRRCGETTVWTRLVRDDVEIGDPLVAHLFYKNPPHFRVSGPSRFVREFLPTTDFAYQGWGWKPDTGPGAEGRPVRSLCCNAKARTALIGAGLTKPSRFRPIFIVSEDDAHAEIIDRTVPIPLPLARYTAEEAATERARREGLLQSAIAPSLGRVFASTAAAEKWIVRSIETGSADWRPARDDPAFTGVAASPLFARTPIAWQRLAPLLPVLVSDQDATGRQFEMVPPEFNTGMAYDEEGSDPDEIPSSKDLIIGRTPYGDWYSVRTTGNRAAADGRVVLWDHETTTISDEWPTIGAFASYLIGLDDSAN